MEGCFDSWCGHQEEEQEEDKSREKEKVGVLKPETYEPRCGSGQMTISKDLRLQSCVYMLFEANFGMSYVSLCVCMCVFA